jgi:hypothetical protein
MILIWRPDPLTFVISAIGAPVVLAIAAIVVRHAKDITGYIVDGVLSMVAPLVKRTFATTLSLRKYSSIQLGGNTKYLSVPARQEIPLETDSVFVALRLEGSRSRLRSDVRKPSAPSRSGIGVEAVRGYSGLDASEVSHETILKVGPRLRIIGDPGSGKSSLVKKIFRDECYRNLRKSPGARLPVIIELRDARPPKDDTDDGWLFELVKTRITVVSAYNMATAFEVCVCTSGLLVMLDGLDEVSSLDYERISKGIRHLSRHLEQQSPRNVVILTMRTHFHSQVRDDFVDFGPHVLTIQPFTPTNIFEFLHRWPYGASLAKQTQECARIYRDLMDRPTLREMCTNPLVLAMYVAEDQTGTDPSIPETRTQFYSRVCDELLVKRRIRGTGVRSGSTPLKQQRERILGVLAFEHLLDHSQPANSLRWNAGIQVSAQVLGDKGMSPEAALLEIGKETGIISEEREGDSFRFIHLTFCEFLAAREAAERSPAGWKQLLQAHIDSRNSTGLSSGTRLLEVIPFAVALLPRSQRDDALDALLKLADARLLMRAFLETKAYDHHGWPGLVEGEFTRLSATPVSGWDEEWLRDLHLLSVTIRDASHSAKFLDVYVPHLDFKSLFNIGRSSENLWRVFETLSRHDASAALRLAESAGVDLPKEFPAIAVRNTDQPPFLALLLERAVSEEGRQDFWAQFFAEAALRSPVVRTALSSSTPHEYWRVPRQEAKRIGWKTMAVPKGSAYAAILSIACDAARKRPYGFAILVMFLSRLPPPRVLMRRDRILAQITGGIILVLISLLSVSDVRAFPKLVISGWVALVLTTVTFTGLLLRLWATTLVLAAVILGSKTPLPVRTLQRNSFSVGKAGPAAFASPADIEPVGLNARARFAAVRSWITKVVWRDSNPDRIVPKVLQSTFDEINAERDAHAL